MVVAQAAGQPEAAQAVANGALAIDELLDCLVIIRELTFPAGLGPLLQRLTVLGVGAVGLRGEDQATNSLPPPNSLLHTDTLSPTL